MITTSDVIKRETAVKYLSEEKSFYDNFKIVFSSDINENSLESLLNHEKRIKVLQT